jgi:hypothetical protein
MPEPDFQVEVIRNGIVIHHIDGHVLSLRAATPPPHRQQQ